MKVIPLIILCLLPLASLNAVQSKHSSREITETVIEPIPVESIRPVAGFAFRGILRLDRPGDNSGQLSPCVLLEDGVPLGPAHATQESIQAHGAGRYLHWAERSVFFSTSDNSDPRTNGRSYTLFSEHRVKRHTATVLLHERDASYDIPAGDAPISNTRLVLRNLDKHAAVTVTMRTEGQPDFTSAQTMIESIVRPGMTDEEKALAIWQFLVNWRYHHHPPEGTQELHDPAKFLGVYGYGYCDDSAHNFVSLCRIAGIEARAWNLARRHIVAEAFYDGGWHMFDADHEVYYRDGDGHVMSVDELAANPAVIRQTEKDPIGFPTKTLAEIYTRPGGNTLSQMIPPIAQHRLAPTLLPQDEVTFDFGLAALTRRVKYRDQPPPPQAGNAVLVRHVDVTASDRELFIPVDWPYVILGGELGLTPGSSEAPEVALSVDGENFHALPVTLNGSRATADLTSWLSNYTGAAYALALRVRGAGGTPTVAAVQAVRLKIVFQFAPRVLPQVQPGGTKFVFKLTSAGESLSPEWAGLEVVHEWDEPL